MAVMVTGGTGFVGSQLVRKLVERGERVVAFDVSMNLKFMGDLVDKVHLVQGDVSSLDEVLDPVKKHDVRCIYHTGGLLTGVCEVVPLRAVRVNAEGVANVLEASRLMNVEKVVFTSTAGVFSRGLTELDDDSPKYPETPYGATKLMGELYGLWYARTYGLDFRAVRYSLVYGPGDPYAYHERSRIIEDPALGRPAEFPFSPSRVGNWLYVKDAAKALLILSDVSRLKRRIYNIGGENRTFQEVADMVRRFIPEAVIGFSPKTSAGREGSALVDRNAREEIGWKPSYTLEMGVKETIDITRERALYSQGVYIRDKLV
jgi:nucleoside-diphosphate-sugar epimerase